MAFFNKLDPKQPIRWDHSASSIESAVSSLIEKSREFLDRIAALPPSKCNFSTVFAAIGKEESKIENITSPLIFYKHVSPSAELRNVANASEKRLNGYDIESSMRIDVFKALKAAKENIDSSGQKLEPEDERLVEKLLLEGKRNGLDLVEEIRTELTALKKELANTTTGFSKNFNEEKGTVTFSRDQLKGVPDDVINGYGRQSAVDGTELFVITFKTPDILPIFKHAHDPETRKKALQAFESRLEINTPLLEKALDLRRKLSALMNYEHWADYMTEVKMIKTGNAVKEFLEDLHAKLFPIGIKERNELLKLKKEEHARLGYPPSNDFFLWDYRHYDNVFVEQSLDLYDNAIKEYSPVDIVVPEILSIYQELLGVQFRTGTGSVWHEEVQHFEVWNANATTEQDFLGDVYLDLYPRENKYSHAAVWGLVRGYSKTALATTP